MANQNNVNEATETLTNASARELKFKKTLSVGGYNKTGTFIAHVPSLMQRIQIGTNRARLLGGVDSQSLDQFTDDLTFMIAYLDVVLTKKPKWFDWETLDNVPEIREIFDEVSNWVNSFQRKSEPNTNGTNSQPTSDEEDMEGDEDI